MKRLNFKLPKINLKFGKKPVKNGSAVTKKKYPNPVFDDWKRAAVEEISSREVVSQIVRKCVVCLVIACIAVSSSFVTGYYRKSFENNINSVVLRGNSVLNEYGNIIKELEMYEKYANMKFKVPLYVQFAALMSSAKLGFFIDSVSFDRSSDLGSLREQFVVETGNNIDSVKIIGSWKIKGFLMNEADNRWVLSFKDSVEGLFSLFGMKSYGSASLRGKDMEATVVVYE